MASCDTCGNDYEDSFEVIRHGKKMTFDCFECAIHACAPVCPRCKTRIIGHGVEAQGNVFCCPHCASSALTFDPKSTSHLKHTEPLI